jgi:GWxTD domain-containing protein
MMCLRILSLVCLSFCLTDAPDVKASVEPLDVKPAPEPASYREGLVKLDADDLEGALSSFKETVASNSRHALAYAGMADVYFRQKNYKDAKFYYNRALNRNPSLTSVLWSLGRLAFIQEDWVAAKKAYGKILERERGNLSAMLNRAIAYRENGKFLATVMRYMEWKKSEQLFRSVEEDDPHFEDVHYQHAVLKRYQGQYKKAILLGEQQVRLKPDLASAHFGLFRLYIHFLDNSGPDGVLEWLDEQEFHLVELFKGEAFRCKGELARADSVLSAWIAMDPPVSVVPAYLSMARLSYAQADRDKGQARFWRAVESIQDSLDAQLLFQDVKYVVNADEMAAFRKIQTRAEWVAFFRKMWVSRDPTPSVQINARLAEHYRRLLYVEQNYLFDGVRSWFNDPDKFDHLEFPETTMLNDRFNDMGLVYVRHGQPSDTQKPADLREVWWYWKTEELPEMVFNFAASPTSVGSNWRLVESVFGDRNAARVRWEVEKHIRKTQRSISEGLELDRHTWEEKVSPLDYDSYLAYFKGDEGQNFVELYYSMDLKDLKDATEGLGSAEPALEYGFSLHDLQWNRLENQHGVVTTAEWDALKYEEWGIGSLRARAEPDSFQAAFFIRPSKGSLMGGWKGGIRVPEISSTELDVSTIVPAYVVDPDKEADPAFSSRGIHIIPNPSRRFPRKDPVNVYFELYNLTPSAGGTTAFEVEYTLTRLKHKGIRKLLAIFGTGKQAATAVSVDRIGETPDSIEYLSLDLSRAGKGDFRLDIKVSDKHAGTEKEASVELTLH